MGHESWVLSLESRVMRKESIVYTVHVLCSVDCGLWRKCYLPQFTSIQYTTSTIYTLNVVCCSVLTMWDYVREWVSSLSLFSSSTFFLSPVAQGILKDTTLSLSHSHGQVLSENLCFLSTFHLLNCVLYISKSHNQHPTSNTRQFTSYINNNALSCELWYYFRKKAYRIHNTEYSSLTLPMWNTASICIKCHHD